VDVSGPRFSGRTVIVTGGGSGIGRVMALRFAGEGAAVVVADVVAAKADEVAREIVESDGKAIAVRTDVSVAADVAGMRAAGEDAFGPVDVLVNNAAVAGGDDILDIDEATWDRDLSVTLKSAFLCSKEVLPGMVGRGSGVIVNIASVNALAYFANEGYSAAKAGMLSLTRSIAVRYGPAGIRCVAIAPGTIRTPIWREREEQVPDVFERLSRWYPLGRVGEPEDIASAALFLASEEASWITGAVLPVDGGLLAGNAQMARELMAEFDSDE
jgi:meso-butanediol dehydrogenase / (S,S)-butanediol dehydrogenase / diacetyl reductase